MRDILNGLMKEQFTNEYDPDGNLRTKPNEPQQPKAKHGDNKGGIMTKSSPVKEDEAGGPFAKGMRVRTKATAGNMGSKTGVIKTVSEDEVEVAWENGTTSWIYYGHLIRLPDVKMSEADSPFPAPDLSKPNDDRIILRTGKVLRRRPEGDVKAGPGRFFTKDELRTPADESVNEDYLEDVQIDLLLATDKAVEDSVEANNDWQDRVEQAFQSAGVHSYVELASKDKKAFAALLQQQESLAAKYHLDIQESVGNWEHESKNVVHDADGNVVAEYPDRHIELKDKKPSKAQVKENIFDHMITEGLVDHAQFEMDKVGLFDEDSDYNGMIAQSVMDLMKVFAGQGHSGCSASITRDLFNRLSQYEVLSSITNDPEEWMEVTQGLGPDSPALWQNKRSPSLFSLDGGKTYYDVDEPQRVIQSEQGISSLEPREDNNDTGID